MKCTKCGHEFNADDLMVAIAAHDDNLFDLVLDCPDCEAEWNTFVSLDDFTDQNE